MVILIDFDHGSFIDISKFEHSSIRHDIFHDFYKTYNYEGILIHNAAGGYSADLYRQIFRNGAVEFFTGRLHEKGELYRNGFETDLINALPIMIQITEYFESSFPYLLFYTILDVKGYKLRLGPFETMRQFYNIPILQNDLMLPDIMIDESSLTNLPLALKPIFDTIWNACGHPQSPNFNSKGEWKVE